MIKLKTLLEEFKYGNELFSDLKDKSVVSKNYIKSLISKAEPNTEDEQLFLKALSKYFSDDVTKTVDASTLKMLLQLKLKFPKILDPTQSEYSSAYRGTTIDIDFLMKSDIKFYNPHTYIIKRPKTTIQSKGSAGYLSFSNSYQQAEIFSKVNSSPIDKLVSTNAFPIVAEISLKNPKLLFNTKFTRALSEFDEEELMLVDTKFTPINIFIASPDEIFKVVKYTKHTKKTAPKFYELQERLKKINL